MTNGPYCAIGSFSGRPAISSRRLGGRCLDAHAVGLRGVVEDGHARLRHALAVDHDLAAEHVEEGVVAGRQRLLEAAPSGSSISR
jgi:hypothetical protein